MIGLTGIGDHDARNERSRWPECALVSEVPEPLRQAEGDVAATVLQLKGRDFLYTPEARGLSLEAIRKVDELVDGFGLIRNQQRIRWRDMATLLDDLEKQPRTRQMFGPVVHEEIRERLSQLRTA